MKVLDLMDENIGNFMKTEFQKFNKESISSMCFDQQKEGSIKEENQIIEVSEEY